MLAKSVSGEELAKELISILFYNVQHSHRPAACCCEGLGLRQYSCAKERQSGAWLLLSHTGGTVLHSKPYRVCKHLD